MPIKDKEKAREYKRLWIAEKRSQQKNVEPKKNNFVEPLKGVEPKLGNVEPSQCSRCELFENSISKFANLYYQEQDKVKEEKGVNYQLEKKIKVLEKKLKNHDR